jgi:alpha-L-rhamnosidase
MKWIWTGDKDDRENTRGCFTAAFFLSDIGTEVYIRICAITKYMLYINGKQIGRGPIRAEKGVRVFDRYAILPSLHQGKNILAVRVWNYGWSTYQSIAEQPGTAFEILQGTHTLLMSDENTLCHEDDGYIRFAPKRNVNLGFSDYYDARKFEPFWYGMEPDPSGWQPAAVVTPPACWRNETRPIRFCNAEDRRAVQLVFIQDVRRTAREITLNTRRAFFGDRRDADETIFSGFIGGVIVSDREQTGIISFPNRTWNGLIGNIRIEDHVRTIDNQHREAEVSLHRGEQLFLIELSGKFDDLYCHMEFRFDETIRFQKLNGDSCFFVIGPTVQLSDHPDGINHVYGGLDEYNHIDTVPDEHIRIWKADEYAELKESCRNMAYIDPCDVYEDLYLLSLARLEETAAMYAVRPEQCGILWNNDQATEIACPKQGEYRRILLDFGDICIGQIQFTLKAAAGTVMDIYGFENFYNREIDYTIGLNNGIHYVTGEGWQTYQCMTRIGLRYALITIRNARESVYIRDFHIRNETYSLSNAGDFACDDDRLNRIFRMCVETNRLCSEDSFTDCPTWEQSYWIGDAQISSLINAWVHGEYDYIRHNHRLALSALDNTPMMNALTPTDWNTSIPLWMMNWIISIFETADSSGDEEEIGELYDAMRSVLLYYSRFISEDGAFVINAWNMLDWAAMDIHNHGVVTGQQGVLAYCFHRMGRYAERTGKQKDADRFLMLQNRLLQYIDQNMWDRDRQAFIDGWSPESGNSGTVSIQTHTLLYLYDAIIDPEKKKIVENDLTVPPETFIRVGSPFMLYYYYQACMNLHCPQMVFRDIKDRWGEMMRFDSSTCWEVFPGFYENSRTRSYCHSWSATPAYFMLRYLLGIEMLEPGFRKIRFTPSPAELKWCRGSIPTPYGSIHVSWSREQGKTAVRMEVPEPIEIEPSGDNVETEITRLLPL